MYWRQAQYICDNSFLLLYIWDNLCIQAHGDRNSIYTSRQPQIVKYELWYWVPCDADVALITVFPDIKRGKSSLQT